MKTKILLIMAGFALFVFILTTSMLWFNFFYDEPDVNTISSIQVQLSDTNNVINEANLIPLDEETAKYLTPYEFRVSNQSDAATTYNVLLEDAIISDDINYSSKELLSRNQLEYQLSLNGRVIKHGMLSDIKNNILDTRNIGTNQENYYQLRIYVSEKAQTSAWQNKYYHFNIRVQMEDK